MTYTSVLRRFIRLSSFVLIVSAMSGLITLPSVTPSQARADELSPSATCILDDIKYLSSDELEGRGVTTKGIQKAAEYIKDQFARAGLDVTPVEGGAFQEFEINDGARLGATNTVTLKGPDGKTIPLTMDKDFTVCAFGSGGTINAPIVFLGYGIEADDIGYNDFKEIDVTGKVVVVMRRNPLQSDHHGPFAVVHGISRHAALTTKLSQAFSHGAAGVLFVNDPFTGRTEQQELADKVIKAQASLEEAAVSLVAEGANPETETQKLRDAVNHLNEVRGILGKFNPDQLMPFGYGGRRSGKSIPCFQISQGVADELLQSTYGKKLTELEQQIDSTKQPLSKELNGWTIEATTDIQQIQVPVKNVIGVLEGEGPLSHETIVIGAHFDHLGWGDDNSAAPGAKEIHNGADDNASGTAGLLELARRLGELKEKLPRRVVFIAFTAEEKGLLGANHYVDNPVFPIEDTVAMFNMDMIGRLEDEKLVIFGTGTSQRWNALIDPLAEKLGFTVSKKPEGMGPSDHASFYAKKIPVLHLFTGTHPDYHRPEDDWEKINASGLARIIDLLEGVVLQTAKAPERPDYINIAGMASLERTGNRPYFGSIPDFGKDVAGYAIQGVAPDSPADKGGLKSGDVIIRLGTHRIGSLEDFDLVLRKFQPGEQVDVGIIRDGKETSLKVTLSTPKG
ncbi:M20/M25/M40 family metallo-hydrolase [Planctomicrobium sp. SH527]|uniref:M20/M25/M40 family metallo-hydrolase n=1 Tax=Planctomicrobium sp. SH527 TaxID=3448123 RepID=UPI003F5C12A1